MKAGLFFTGIGVGEICDTLSTGLFCEKIINAGSADGLFFGTVKLFLIQGRYLVACIAYAFIVTRVHYTLVGAFIGMRVEKDDELVGLDLTQHHESPYTPLE